MTTVSVSQLPKLRDQLVRQALSPDGALRRAVTDHRGGAGLERLLRTGHHLRTGHVFYATKDMTALAMHAGLKLKDTSWNVEARPSPCGVLFFEGGASRVQLWGAWGPAQALVWGPGPAGTCHIEALVLAEQFERQLNRPLVEGGPKLSPVVDYYPPAREGVADDDLAINGRNMIKALNAAWYLMRQPTVVDARPVRTGKGKGARSLPHEVPFTRVTLRRAYTPTDVVEEPGDSDGRTYSHRWVVSGHWRNQAKGPGWSQREQIWIAEHEAGPAGAELVVKEKINVWRR